MMLSASRIRGYGIDANDGEVGKTTDVLFDDARWSVRYLVVDLGGWLPGRQILLSPAAVGTPDWAKSNIPVALSKDQIEQSPSIAADRPVSRQLESDIVEHFGWPVYWSPATHAFGAMASGSPPPPVAPQPEAAETDTGAEPDPDPHLRSAREVAGYHIEAADGEIGHIEDLIIDDEDWAVRYLIVDTRNWLPGRKVILAPDWFKEFNWKDAKASTELSKEKIENAPTFDASQPVNRDYEGRLYDYYGRPAYWTAVAAPGLGWKV